MIACRIWRHLADLVKCNKTTVVVSTHHIEEAAQADTVAILRNGRVLDHAAPRLLTKKYNCNNLHDVMMKMSDGDVTGDAGGEPVAVANTANNNLEETPSVRHRRRLAQEVTLIALLFRKYLTVYFTRNIYLLITVVSAKANITSARKLHSVRFSSLALRRW